MQEQKEVFGVAVNINYGLEPLSFHIVAYDDPATPEHVLNFQVSRNKEILGTIGPDAEHQWRLLTGSIEQEQVEAIGAAIDGHYA